MFGASKDLVTSAAVSTQLTTAAKEKALRRQEKKKKAKENAVTTTKVAEQEIQKVLKKVFAGVGVGGAGGGGRTSGAEGGDAAESGGGANVNLEVKGVPDEDGSPWPDWIQKTGMNSLCCDATWDFATDTSSHNAAKVAAYGKTGINNVVMTVHPNPEEASANCCPGQVCEVWWEPGETTMTIAWLPAALTWRSETTWDEEEEGQRRWWVLRDPIVYHLGLYQAQLGKCFYKSDWLTGFDESHCTGGHKSERRWVQFRHWLLFWFTESRPGWNYQWSAGPHSTSYGEPFAMSDVTAVPEMPELLMPILTLPHQPDIELPEENAERQMPDEHGQWASRISYAPNITKVATSAAFGGGSKKKKRPPNRWAAHGYIQLHGLHCVERQGKLILSGAKVTNFYVNDGDTIEGEEAENVRLELSCSSTAQANSWVATLVAAGCEKGEVSQGGCCVLQ